MLSGRISDALFRYRYPIFGVWLLHTFLIHYHVIGFMSWDGFGHRGFPLIELYQHGGMHKEKFNEWSLTGYTPFIELAHLPFLYVFKMRGLLIGFPLVVFPLCVAAVWKLVRELTGNERAAMYGAFAYLAIPMVNEQPFTGYVDFAVAGILAYWLYAVLRVSSSDRPIAPYVRLVIASFLLAMARSQGVYVMAVLFPLLGYALFATRERFRIRLSDRRKVVLAVVAIALGSIPSVGLQIYKYYAYGSPIAPMQFQFLGIKIGTGVTMDTYFRYAGLDGDGLASLAKGFWDGWIWPHGWPIGAFYASRFLAAGLLFLLMLVLLPVFLRRATRVELWLLGGGVLVSLLSRDFAVPRWAYTTVIAIAVVIGRAVAELSESRRGQPLFWLALVLLVAHLFRPELDLLQIKSGPISPRMNVVGSKHYRKGDYDIPVYPDRKSHRFVIIEAPGNNFVLPIYGKRLRNEILGTLLAADLGADCAGAARFLRDYPDAVFIDDLDHTKACHRECAVKAPWGCRAWKLQPAP